MASRHDRSIAARATRSRLVGALGIAGAIGYAVYLNGGATRTGFHGSPMQGWLFWTLAAVWAWGILLNAACASAGHWVLTHIERMSTGTALATRPALETLVLSAALGLIVFVLGMYGAGFAHLYNAAFAVLWPLLMLAVGMRRALTLVQALRGAWERRPLSPPNEPTSEGMVWLASAFGLVGVLLVYAGVMTLWTLAGVAAMGAWLVGQDRARGVWAAFFLFPAIFVYDKNLGGAADHDVAFFAAPLFLAIVRAAPGFNRRACALAGVYAGGALLTKYQAAYLLTGCGAVFCLLWGSACARKLGESKKAPGEGSGEGLARGGAGPAAGAPPAPPSPGWSDLVTGPLALAGAFAFVVAPHFLKNAAFYGNPFYPFLQDVFASHPTTPKAAALFETLFLDDRWRPHHALGRKLFSAFALCFTWPFDPHYSFTRDVPDQGALFTPAPFYSGRDRILATIDLLRSTYEGQAASRFSGFRAEERAVESALPPNARVLLHMTRPNLGIDRETRLDWAGQQGQILYETVAGPRALFDLYRSIGITHLLWPRGRSASTRQEDILFFDFVHRYGQGLCKFETESLVALPLAPPPADTHYRIAAIGLHGYADGVYPLAAMTVYETLPGPAPVFPSPEVPWPEDPTEQATILAGANAVDVYRGKGDPLNPGVQARLTTMFDVAETLGDDTIYVRPR